jgi:hypothetical protein
LDLVTLARVPVTPRFNETSRRPLAWIPLLAACALPLTAGVQLAAAQGGVESGRLALMPSASLDASTTQLATALDTVLLTQLETVAGVSAAARPALDLPAMQLALDCVGETPACLRAVTTQTASDSLLAPTVQVAGGETVVTLLYFDVRDGELRNVVRRHSGPDVQRAALDAVPSMLRELFGIAEPIEPPASVEPEPDPAPLDDSAIEPPVEPSERAFPVAPVVVGGVGVLLIGAGVVFGLAANASEEDWLAAPVKTEVQIDDALEIEESADRQALLANVGFALGGATLAASVVWLALELSGDEPSAGGEVARASQLMLLPRLAPSTAGVTLRGSL